MMKRYISLLLLLFFIGLSGCGGPTKQDYRKLKGENTILKSKLEKSQQKVKELSNTPEMRLAKGLKYQSENDMENAKMTFNDLIKLYPGTEEADKASLQLKVIVAKEKKLKKEAERRKALGFKVLNEDYKVKVGNVTLDFTSINLRNRWVFDSYKNEYHYRDAERGEKYIVGRLSISSEIKEPKLPPICAYKLSDGNLHLVGVFEYKFRHWKDYGAYLGNYADYGNSFAHTKTIRFTCGYQISDNIVDNNAVFIVVKNKNCFYRHDNRFDNPPVSYRKMNCNPKSLLSVKDFMESYILIKIFNKSKL